MLTEIIQSHIFILLTLCFLISYFFGSIPFGLILTRVWGYGDIRNVGSGNIGATNVLRTGNRVLAFIVLTLDAFKGFVVIKELVNPDEVKRYTEIAERYDPKNSTNVNVHYFADYFRFFDP